MNTFNPGDRVVPISKTVPGWDGLGHSYMWKFTQKIGQPY